MFLQTVHNIECLPEREREMCVGVERVCGSVDWLLDCPEECLECLYERQCMELTILCALLEEMCR